RVRGTQKALAMTVDCTPRYCAADPVMGGKQAVAETYRNLCAVGATPLAITDNMNFGNPEKPHIMGQFAGAVLGIREACLVLDYPVVSGNCSLYNETKGQPILPAPAIGGVGMIPDVAKTVPNQFSEGQQIFLVGINAGEIGQSLYLREIFGREEGAPPPVDLAAEKTHGTFVRDAIRAGIITACHDVSDGGLLVALAEMAMRGGCGATLSYAPPTPQHWFAEDQACYVVTTTQPKALSEHANAANVPLTHLGRTGGPTLNVGAEQLSVDTLRLFHEAWLPNFMEPQG
ncbi:MAG: phosphoribosylformylglycinamidine synthase II, partial [Alphaproteobacteria bacterium]|nr:phosphoribosylformylglycinamidine synthase II [Alphaproteobacteria bacterium]